MSGHSWLMYAGSAPTAFGIGRAFPMLLAPTLGLSPPAEQGRGVSAWQPSNALCGSATLALASTLFARSGGSERLRYVLVLAMCVGVAFTGPLMTRRACA